MTNEQAKDAALEPSARRQLTELKRVLGNCVSIQSESGNWNYSPYMMGLANGLIMAYAFLMGEDAKFKEAPEQWIQDRRVDSVHTDHALLMSIAEKLPAQHVI